MDVFYSIQELSNNCIIYDQNVREFKCLLLGRSLRLSIIFCHKLASSVKKHLSCAYGDSHFQFCCSAWGCCGVTKLQTLQKLQNQVARIVIKSSFDTPSVGLIQSIN